MIRKVTWGIMLGIALAGAAGHGVSEDKGPDARWLHVYGWLQTGEKLSEAEQPALALGSYIEANRQLEALAETFPEFEPEIVAYRHGWLQEEIRRLDESLDASEHDTMMKYLDFIELLDQGLDQRFENRFGDALTTLDIARRQMDEIIAEKPEAFREAVSSQYDLLVENIEWLDSQVNFTKRSRPASYAWTDTVDWGTTKYVKEADLPGERGNMVLSGALFPEGSIPVQPDLTPLPNSGQVEPEADGAEEDRSSTARLFRMSSQGSPGAESAVE